MGNEVVGGSVIVAAVGATVGSAVGDGVLTKDGAGDGTGVAAAAETVGANVGAGVSLSFPAWQLEHSSNSAMTRCIMDRSILALLR